MNPLKALLGAGMYLLTLIVLPRLAADRIPTELVEQFGSTEGMISTLTWAGIFLASIYFLKNMTSKENPVNLASGILLDFSELYLFLYFIGFGNPWSLGKVSETITLMGKATLFADFSLFAKLMILCFAIKLLASILEFIDAREELKKSKPLSPSPLPQHQA